MSQPDLPRPGYGQQRTCSHCGTRVAQKAQTCFFCGAALDSGPRRSFRLPWADFVLFAAIIAVVAIWWLRAPEPPEMRQSAVNGAGLETVPGTPALLAQLVPEEVLPTVTSTVTATTQPTDTPAPTETPIPTPATAIAPLRHKVLKGDTVSGIAQKYGSTIKDVIEANALAADGRLSVGQDLIIPLAGPSGGPGPTALPGATATPNPGVIYTVSSGDTLSNIAERFGSRVDWIQQANNMKPGELLPVGRVLLVPGNSATITPTPTSSAEVVAAAATAIIDPGLAAPALLSPSQAAIVTGESAVLLSWTSVAVLKGDEWYVVTLRSNEDGATVATHWTRSTTWRLPNDFRGNGSAGLDYSWRVQVRVGSEDNPGPAVSPSSVERRFTWR